MSENAEKPHEDELEAEFDMLLARAGMTVPEDWKSGILRGYAELKPLAAILRSPRPAFDEPANIFDLKRIVE